MKSPIFLVLDLQSWNFILSSWCDICIQIRFQRIGSMSRSIKALDGKIGRSDLNSYQD